MSILAEYIWIDGTRPTAQLRSKTKVMPAGEVPPSHELKPGSELDPSVFPEWGADGSSTNQASGSDSDIGLKPVRAVPDPIRAGHYLVLCEVFDGAGNVHESNKRARLRQVLDTGGAKAEAWFGFEQEYTFLDRTGHPLGFPPGGYPGPQGPYYCAVGSQWIYGRKIYEAFLQACIDARLEISGVNWEVMPGQAEFQIGAASALVAPDHMWLARWLLLRIAEDHNTIVSFSPKPAIGDWNGAGMHTNFSTRAMREPGGMEHIITACKAIGRKRQEHLDVYGDGYELRLTGHHETCSYKEFRYGVADRTASIRIPRHVADKGYGYLEDRRPNANADPYEIAARLIATVTEIEIDLAA